MGNIFVPNIPPLCESESRYTTLQEALRKDIERCFGVLQAKFETFCKESHYWDNKFIFRVSGVCFTFHNMVVRLHKYGAFDNGCKYSQTEVDIISQFYDKDL